MSTKDMAAGGYRYIPGVMQYSAGVAALPGYRLERARFSSVVPLKEGFDRIKAHLESLGLPLTAFCACELRSPGQFTEEGFDAFNRLYVGTLREWGVMAPESADNPVARSNICPEVNPPAEPGFFAFSYVVPDVDAPASFVIAGSGEVPEGKNNYADHIVRPGDVSPEGLREKARFVLDEMQRRMSFFGGTWADVTVTQIYTVHDIHPFLADELMARGAGRGGVTWHFNRPPIVGLDYEMDCRSVFCERVLKV